MIALDSVYTIQSKSIVITFLMIKIHYKNVLGSGERTIGFVLKSFLHTYQLFALYLISQESTSGLVKPEEFTPYDPTQDAIFPPELMVSQLAKQVQFHTCFRRMEVTAQHVRVHTPLFARDSHFKLSSRLPQTSKPFMGLVVSL